MRGFYNNQRTLTQDPIGVDSQTVKTRTVHLEDVCERIDYGFTASADFSVKEPRLLRITDIQEGSADWNHVPGCRIAPEEEADKRLCAGASSLPGRAPQRGSVS